MVTRSEARWDARVKDPEHWRDGASPKYFVLVELDGQAEAFAMYRVKEKVERGTPLSEVQLVDVIATSPAAAREIWRYLFGDRPRRARHPVELGSGLAALSNGQGRSPAAAACR